MDTETHRYALEQIPADRGLIEQLFSHGRISGEAREMALNLIHPHDQWGAWASRLLLILGTALTLSGFVYFFAFNWAEIPPAVKLSAIECGIVACLGGATFYSLKGLSGQVALLSASVLVGVFMAVFGQIYQTGADAFELFMMWSLLTFGWTLLANFAAQWLFWLVITNCFLVLWWEQAAQPDHEMHFMIFACLALFNGAALALREMFLARGRAWLAPEWTRALPAVATLILMLIPIEAWIIESSRASLSIILSAVLGIAGHVVFYFVYRYKLPDMWVLSATILSACVILETGCFRMLSEMLGRFDAAMLLTMGFLTLGIFTAAIIYLRGLIKTLEATDA